MFITLPSSGESDSQSCLSDWIIGSVIMLTVFRLVVQKGDKFKDERTGACSEKIAVYCKRVTNRVRFAKQSLHFFFLPSATKLRRLCFYTCLSFCSQGGVPGQVPHPRDQVHPLGPGTPPGRYTPYPVPGTSSRTRYTPWDQVHPQAGTPPRTRYTPVGPGTPQDQVQPPGTRYIPQQAHPPGTRYTPWAGTPPGTRYTPHLLVLGTPPWTRYTPQSGTPPMGPGTPLGPSTPPSTSTPPADGYCWASHWNAILFYMVWPLY